MFSKGDIMKKLVLMNAVLAGSIAFAASALAQTAAPASPDSSPAVSSPAVRSEGASGPTPYGGPTSYGTVPGSDQQGGSIRRLPALRGGITATTDAYAECADVASNQDQWQSCMKRHNDATWNAGGVQDDHGQ
jgi:hypothetical protein